MIIEAGSLFQYFTENAPLLLAAFCRCQVDFTFDNLEGQDKVGSRASAFQ